MFQETHRFFTTAFPGLHRPRASLLRSKYLPSYRLKKERPVGDRYLRKVSCVSRVCLSIYSTRTELYVGVTLWCSSQRRRGEGEAEVKKSTRQCSLEVKTIHQTSTERELFLCLFRTSSVSGYLNIASIAYIDFTKT